MKLDFDKCHKAMEQIRVYGDPTKTYMRHSLIEEAMGYIKANPQQALRKHILGIKNYDGFGDQRCDCEYGFGPRHGHIVFSIERNCKYHGDLDVEACTYLLAAISDFGWKQLPNGKRGNLFDFLTERQRLIDQFHAIEVAIRQMKTGLLSELFPSISNKNTSIAGHEDAIRAQAGAGPAERV